VEAQAAYDTAVRALNKIDRQIYDLKIRMRKREKRGRNAFRYPVCRR